MTSKVLLKELNPGMLIRLYSSRQTATDKIQEVLALVVIHTRDISDSYISDGGYGNTKHCIWLLFEGQYRLIKWWQTSSNFALDREIDLISNHPGSS